MNSSSDHPLKRAARAVSSQLIIGLVTFSALRLHANAATSGFAFLITILGIAVWTDLSTSLVSSFVATLCYNYFFLPPVRTFTIQDPANWVALISFFIASIVATRLMLRARMQADHAESRRMDVEALYALSIQLFTATNRVGALGEAASRALANVGAIGGGLVLFGNGTYDQRLICWSGPREEEIEDLIAGVGRHKRTLEFPAMAGRDVYLPLNIGGDVIGVLAAAVRRQRFAHSSLRRRSSHSRSSGSASLRRARMCRLWRKATRSRPLSCVRSLTISRRL